MKRHDFHIDIKTLSIDILSSSRDSWLQSCGAQGELRTWSFTSNVPWPWPSSVCGACVGSVSSADHVYAPVDGTRPGEWRRRAGGERPLSLALTCSSRTEDGGDSVLRNVSDHLQVRTAAVTTQKTAINIFTARINSTPFYYFILVSYWFIFVLWTQYMKWIHNGDVAFLRTASCMFHPLYA